MTRTSSTLGLVLTALVAAVATVPAAATEGQTSVNAITGGSSSQPAVSGGGSSINATLGAESGQPASGSPSTSINALVGVPSNAGPGSSPVTRGDTRSVKAILGGRDAHRPFSAPVADVAEGDGFRWGDALLGGLIASLMLLAMLGTARSVARHRRATLGSRA